MFSALKEIKRSGQIAAKYYHVIFYAENQYYFQYFRDLYEDLLKNPALKICYITSDEKDPVLTDGRVESFFIKQALGGLFPRLKADVMIMTMPDLQNFLFKRSATVKKYIYVFHALVSTHQQYRYQAFDHYDTIFCPGPHHEKEIRVTEDIFSLPKKEIVSYGYPLLYNIPKAETVPGKVLIAPSWYSQGILNTVILELIETLVKDGKQVWLRPHPEFVKRNPKVFKKILSFAERSLVRVDNGASVFTHFDAEWMITDRSGIAFEYAFLQQRPVMFINTPLKIENPQVDKIPLEPIENSYRNMIGKAVVPGEISTIPAVLKEMSSSPDTYRLSIEKARFEILHPAPSATNGRKYIEQLLGL